MLEGRNGDNTFRSKGGRGEWIQAGSLTSGLSLGNEQRIAVPKNLPADYKQRGWHGAVPAWGVRIRGTRTPDAGAATLKATKHQVISHVDALINNNFKNPYMQQREDLARLAYVGMEVNPEAEWLDRRLVGDGEAPLDGFWPHGMLSPDVGIAGNSAKPFVSLNTGNYPYLNPRDCLWRQLEGQTVIATAAPAASTFDFFQSIPFCAGTGSLIKDSIPVDTLADLSKPWEFSLKIARDPATSFVKNGGSFVITRIDLYLYIIPVRDIDPRTHGLPFRIVRKNRAQSPLQYSPGEVVLFTGNMPITGEPAYTDTVNGFAYSPCITFGDFKGDLTSGNVLEWATSGQTPRFPYWFQDRNPRHVYESIHNARPNSHLIRYGSPTDVMVVGGRDMSASTGVSNRVDAANFATLLGGISPWPLRVLAETAMEVEGFPGFGALDKSCGDPYLDMSGTTDFSGATSVSAINGKQGMLDVVLNNSMEDRIYIEDLGRGCCRDGTITFSPTAANPDSDKAAIVAGKITTWEQKMPGDRTATVAGLTSAVAAAASDATVAIKKA